MPVAHLNRIPVQWLSIFFIFAFAWYLSSKQEKRHFQGVDIRKLCHVPVFFRRRHRH